MANMKGGKGMRTTGIAGCFCARHEFVQVLGLAALKKGERYNTMDWILCGALSFLRCAEVTVSYDIACQWSKRLHERLSKIAPDCIMHQGALRFMKHHLDRTITYVVPKFHLYAHKAFCQLRYALGLLLGTGLTDGEGCERVWSGANPAASSLREMGAGGMSDTMDDMCNAWNWKKTCGIAVLLCARMCRALEDGTTQTKIFTQFTEALEADDPTRIAQARVAIRTWEQDLEKKEGTPCPYYVEQTALSSASIKMQSETVQGMFPKTAGSSDADEDAALSRFIVRGFNLEADRERFSVKHKAIGGTSAQAMARSLAVTSMLHDVLSFRSSQETLCPSVYAALTLDERDPDRHAATTVKLYLPSNPPDKDRSLVSDRERAIEAQLRWDYMVDELHRLRQQLRLRGCLNKFKIANITGQYNNTRARETQDIVNANVKKAAVAYRRHRAAYLLLVGKGKWEETMRVLNDKDCRGLGDRLLEQMEEMTEENVKKFLEGRRGAASSGETRYELPWIWYNHTEDSGLQITDGAQTYLPSLRQKN
ncbi:unnamed protein product [Peniophora sp. CBMAI 1063]|nr:unnamed protein product [Peniophora sp. CBMAI 1063]